VILDELGYLPFPLSSRQLLFHLVSRLFERTAVIVTTFDCYRRKKYYDLDIVDALDLYAEAIVDHILH